jgi:hypothetical protein
VVKASELHSPRVKLLAVLRADPAEYIDVFLHPVGQHFGLASGYVNGRILYWSITSALAGFLFSFDTVVISGAEQKIQSLWSLGAGMNGIAMTSALYGTVLGSLIGGWPTDRFGRKPTLLFIGILYFVGAFGSGLATNVYTFIIARVIGGLGIGISTVVAPLYMSEIAPPKHRGRLAGMFQFNIVFGILVAYLSNALRDYIRLFRTNFRRPFLDMAATHPDPACLSHCILQSDVWNQCHSLLRSAHFRDDRFGDKGCVASSGWHRCDQSHFHFCRLEAY